MREAEQHGGDDAVEPAHHSDTEKVSTVPFALGFASPRMPTPLEGGVAAAAEASVDVDFEDDDGGSDEEGETQVDAKRSAAALKEMRTLETTSIGPAPTAPSSDARTPPPVPMAKTARGLPPGRPPASSVLPPPSAANGPASAGPSTLTFPPAVLAAAIRPQAPSASDRPEHMFSSSRLQFGTVAPPPVAGVDTAPALARPRGVGRRTGAVIAVSTAAAVALIVGAWTARQPESISAASSNGTMASRLAASAHATGALMALPPPPSTAVVVATPPAAATTPAPEEAVLPPTEAPAPVDDVPALAAIAPSAAQGATTVAPTLTSKHAAASAAKKARLSRKAQAASNKRRLRAQRAAAKNASHAAVGPTPASAARPASRAAESARGGRSDPDDTLPPTD